jgi:hypothetical protein
MGENKAHMNGLAERSLVAITPSREKVMNGRGPTFRDNRDTNSGRTGLNDRGGRSNLGGDDRNGRGRGRGSEKPENPIRKSCALFLGDSLQVVYSDNSPMSCDADAGKCPYEHNAHQVLSRSQATANVERLKNDEQRELILKAIKECTSFRTN